MLEESSIFDEEESDCDRDDVHLFLKPNRRRRSQIASLAADIFSSSTVEELPEELNSAISDDEIKS